MNKCNQCKKELDPMSQFTKYPDICLQCVKKNHKKLTGGK
jgi:hypothetical protein